MGKKLIIKGADFSVVYEYVFEIGTVPSKLALNKSATIVVTSYKYPQGQPNVKTFVDFEVTGGTYTKSSSVVNYTKEVVLSMSSNISALGVNTVWVLSQQGGNRSDITVNIFGVPDWKVGFYDAGGGGYVITGALAPKFASVSPLISKSSSVNFSVSISSSYYARLISGTSPTVVSRSDLYNDTIISNLNNAVVALKSNATGWALNLCKGSVPSSAPDLQHDSGGALTDAQVAEINENIIITQIT